MFGNEPTKALAILVVLDEYKHNMRGCNIADQLHGNFRTHKRSVWAWLCLLYWLLDVATSNSYIAMKTKFPDMWEKSSGHNEAKHCSSSNACFNGSR